MNTPIYALFAKNECASDEHNLFSLSVYTDIKENLNVYIGVSHVETGCDVVLNLCYYRYYSLDIPAAFHIMRLRLF